MKFTMQAYRELLELIQNKGYDICNYHNYLNSEKFVIMRHDVDFDLRKAAQMAEVEKEFGIKSIYYVLISSDFYNVISAYNSEWIKKILDCGHEIGLHFDETKYKCSSIQEIKKEIYHEIRLLESIIGHRVGSVSMHRPSKEMLESDLNLDYVVNTYGSTFFHDIKYLSDARMNWREDVLSILENESHSKIQLLTHPFWYTEKDMTITEKLKEFALRATEERYEELSCNLRDINSILTRENLYGTQYSEN